MTKRSNSFLQGIADAIRLAGLPVQNIEYLASGEDSEVLLCDKKWVVKLPKRREAQAALQREFALYVFLCQQNLPFQIPQPVYICADFSILSFLDGAHLSYRKYQRLSTSEKEALAYDEARFLRALHSLSVDTSMPPFCGAAEDKRQKLRREQEEICRILDSAGLLSYTLQEKIILIYVNLFSNKRLFQYTPCLVHNDFSADNMIFRNKRLYGVIDFGDFVIGDPDNDFFCILDSSRDDFGKDFGRKVLRHYAHPAPEIAERKAEIHESYWPLEQILLGSRRGDAVYIRQGLRKLRRLDPKAFVF